MLKHNNLTVLQHITEHVTLVTHNRTYWILKHGRTEFTFGREYFFRACQIRLNFGQTFTFLKEKVYNKHPDLNRSNSQLILTMLNKKLWKESS